MTDRPDPHTLATLKALAANGPEIVATYKDMLNEYPIAFQIIESAIQHAERAKALKVQNYQLRMAILKAYDELSPWAAEAGPNV